MGFSFPQTGSSGIVLESHLSVKAAAGIFGYNEQYLRRLLRSGRLEGIKVGQVWLIKVASIEQHLQECQSGQNQCDAPQGEIAEPGRAASP
jgi:excisionase family DNA binding protein